MIYIVAYLFIGFLVSAVVGILLIVEDSKRPYANLDTGKLSLALALGIPLWPIVLVVWVYSRITTGEW